MKKQFAILFISLRNQRLITKGQRDKVSKDLFLDDLVVSWSRMFASCRHQLIGLEGAHCKGVINDQEKRRAADRYEHAPHIQPRRPGYPELID